MAKKKSSVDEKELSKGQIRKLNALRKSIGDDLGDEAFAKWLAQSDGGDSASDPNIEMLEDALSPLLGKLRIPRGNAYAVRRGRGRIIVEAVSLK